jgi:hypothetical protein
MLAYHIHTDLKFLKGTNKFHGAGFENRNIIIGNNLDSGEFINGELVFDYTPASISKIVSICKKADLVVLYDLDLIKSAIALQLPRDLRIAWRFFGYELYKRTPDLYASDLTLRVCRLNPGQKLTKVYYDSKRYFNQRLVWGCDEDRFFTRAVERIDYFLGFSQEEYDGLLETWPNLPEFIRLPLSLTFTDDQGCCETKGNSIIVGNNRSMYNNHLDILQIIDSAARHTDYQFILLLSYGPDGKYYKELLKTVAGKKYYKIIENFMPFSQLRDHHLAATAAVFNGFRQMALGNIFLAMATGVKIYLNPKNVIMHWLKREGFDIYPVEDFSNDLANDNLTLNSEEILKNKSALVKLQESYTNENFLARFITGHYGNQR